MAKCLGLLVFIISLQLVASALAIRPSENDEIIKNINAKGPYLGLISVHSTEQEAFLSTCAFQSDAQDFSVYLSGREYLVGTVHERRVILVKSGSGMVNAAAVTQQLLDVFHILGIVHFGLAGILDYAALCHGDVTIPAQFINAGIWKWTNPSVLSERDDINRLRVREYNSPKGDDNLLGHFLYKKEEFYSVSHNSSQDLMWQDVNPDWLEAASNLEGTIKLRETKCARKETTQCAAMKPKLVVGQRASTSNIFVDNSAYRKFLQRTLKVTSADKESSAVILTSLSNGYPVIVVRGLSNLAGATLKFEECKLLAAQNVARTVIELTKVLPYPVPSAGMGHGPSKLRMSVN